MYHYVSGKDELFLQCVEHTFCRLAQHVAREAQALAGKSDFEAVRQYFMGRERFFQLHAQEKNVFENALLRPPKHLKEQIARLHQPLSELNRRFLKQAVAHMPLRPGMDAERAMCYLEGVSDVLAPLLMRCRTGKDALPDVHAMLAATEELLEMVLYGVVRQEGGHET